MDLDPDKVGNNMAQAAVQAEILRQFKEANPPPAQPGVKPPESLQSAPAGAQVQDTQGSGGGTIGTGTVPQRTGASQAILTNNRYNETSREQYFKNLL